MRLASAKRNFRTNNDLKSFSQAYKLNTELVATLCEFIAGFIICLSVNIRFGEFTSLTHF